MAKLWVPHGQQKAQTDTAKQTGKDFLRVAFVRAIPFAWIAFSPSLHGESLIILPDLANTSMKVFLPYLIFFNAPNR